MKNVGILKKHGIVLQIGLLVLATIFFSWDAGRPLVDYDEATYAKVAVDTLQSGNFLTLQLDGQPWFEKPPLYLWLAMGSISLFGEHEFAFRLPSILASVLCCWLVFLIIRALTRDTRAASLGFLVLLFSSSFFVYAREIRLDSAVVAAILATLFLFIKSWKEKKYAFWIFPCIALGFLFKSVIIFLAVPITLLYSIFYRKWADLKNSYLWLGGALGLVIVIPWHLYETITYGHVFWDSYFGTQVLHRATTTLTGTNTVFDYLALLISYLPWNIALVAGLGILLGAESLEAGEKKSVAKDVFAPVCSALLIIFLFTLAQTHLAPYIMPAFALLAIGVAMTYYHLSLVWPDDKDFFSIVALLAVLAGFAFCVYLMSVKIPPYTRDEAAVGHAYREHGPNGAPLYLLDWIPSETFNYYGGVRAQALNPAVVTGQLLKGPFYLSVSPVGVTYFFETLNKPRYPGLKILYAGEYFILIYSDRDLQLPTLRWNP